MFSGVLPPLAWLSILQELVVNTSGFFVVGPERNVTIYT
jgi:hypothetical protein